MEQLNNLADSRLALGCVYCGAAEDTREHVPSRVFLDSPYPENLPVVGACRPCNNGFSMDEEYVACLIEAVISGTTDTAAMRRPGIVKTLQRSPGLRQRIEAARIVGPAGVSFGVEPDRIRRVLVKLAVGHAVYELAQECRAEPVSVWWRPIDLLTAQERDEFDAPDVVQLFGEVGSRGMQRLRVLEIMMVSESGQPLTQQMILNDWVEVQPGRYRYHSSDDGGVVCVRMVIGEYLAGEVMWEL